MFVLSLKGYRDLKKKFFFFFCAITLFKLASINPNLNLTHSLFIDGEYSSHHSRNSHTCRNLTRATLAILAATPIPMIRDTILD